MVFDLMSAAFRCLTQCFPATCFTVSVSLVDSIRCMMLIKTHCLHVFGIVFLVVISNLFEHLVDAFLAQDFLLSSIRWRLDEADINTYREALFVLLKDWLAFVGSCRSAQELFTPSLMINRKK